MASGLDGFVGLSALLKPEVAAIFSAVVAGGCGTGGGGVCGGGGAGAAV